MKKFESRESRVEGPKQCLGLRTQFDFRHSTLNPRPFRGFTLIEMLVVILIIAILASLILGVAAIAAETARENSSRHTVERLHTLLTEFYGTFKTRRIQLRPDDVPTTGQKGIQTQINSQFANPNDAPLRGKATAEARLYAMREMMLVDMPDRWSDVLLNDVGTGSGPPSNVALPPVYLQARTELSNVYLRRYLNLIGRPNTLTGQPNTADEVQQNQSAECLYMIVTLACGDGEARAQFAEHTIGDTDGDGAPEFLDGWGHPISFLRWAPGFDSQIELNQTDLNALAQKDFDTAVAKDHDPYDVFRADPKAFRLVPLIYSGGRDESEGLFTAPNAVTWFGFNNQALNFNAPANSPPIISKPALSPYLKLLDSGIGVSDYLGKSLHVVDSNKFDETSTDNVHNHLLGQR